MLPVVSLSFCDTVSRCCHGLQLGCGQALANGEVDMLPAYWTPGGLYNRTYARVATFDESPCPTFNTDYTPFINASE